MENKYYIEYKGIFYRWVDVPNNKYIPSDYWELFDNSNYYISNIYTYNCDYYRLDQAMDHFAPNVFYGKPEKWKIWVS